MKIKGFLSLNDIQSGKLVIGRALDDVQDRSAHLPLADLPRMCFAAITCDASYRRETHLRRCVWWKIVATIQTYLEWLARVIQEKPWREMEKTRANRRGGEEDHATNWTIDTDRRQLEKKFAHVISATCLVNWIAIHFDGTPLMNIICG